MAIPPESRRPLDGYATEFNKQQHVNYLSTDLHVNEMVYTDHWEHFDLSEAAGALGLYLPSTASPLVGYATEFNNQHHVIYLGQDGDVHELVYKDDWYHTDLIGCRQRPVLSADKGRSDRRIRDRVQQPASRNLSWQDLRRA